ncbi:MAG: hypothetical protein PUJ62_13505 [Lachnospiraceae bacterium]|nr:hypothetical protein [Lachnospiraceae bacterium]
MINWYKNLYVGDTAQKKQKKLIYRIEHGKFTPDVWLITLSTNEQNHLDILPAASLKQPYVKEHLPMIVGLAVSYEESLCVVEHIVKEVYRETGDTKIREWLLSHNSNSVS